LEGLVLSDNSFEKSLKQGKVGGSEIADWLKQKGTHARHSHIPTQKKYNRKSSFSSLNKYSKFSALCGMSENPTLLPRLTH